MINQNQYDFEEVQINFQNLKELKKEANELRKKALEKIQEHSKKTKKSQNIHLFKTRKEYLLNRIEEAKKEIEEIKKQEENKKQKLLTKTKKLIQKMDQEIQFKKNDINQSQNLQQENLEKLYSTVSDNLYQKRIRFCKELFEIIPIYQISKIEYAIIDEKLLKFPNSNLSGNYSVENIIALQFLVILVNNLARIFDLGLPYKMNCQEIYEEPFAKSSQKDKNKKDDYSIKHSSFSSQNSPNQIFPDAFQMLIHNITSLSFLLGMQIDPLDEGKPFPIVFQLFHYLLQEKK
ncbi:uv radiation resistance-associated protein [Anaeramoeba ignava]|uniref:Uv radiation resistance-associated protein n=1 Tax=Anaeramoeba ignava TaxID=1746090 RepID=A0A9Q0R741_ANAIG|nr:uv radiation resistance-associated protein [Anaeramoeba ignava]